MPEKSSASGPNYRWEAGDVIHPLGWSNISGNFAVWNLTDDTGTSLMNAVTLQVAAAALVTSALCF